MIQSDIFSAILMIFLVAITATNWLPWPSLPTNTNRLFKFGQGIAMTPR